MEIVAGAKDGNLKAGTKAEATEATESMGS